MEALILLINDSWWLILFFRRYYLCFDISVLLTWWKIIGNVKLHSLLWKFDRLLLWKNAVYHSHFGPCLWRCLVFWWFFSPKVTGPTKLDIRSLKFSLSWVEISWSLEGSFHAENLSFEDWPIWVWNMGYLDLSLILEIHLQKGATFAIYCEH